MLPHIRNVHDQYSPLGSHTTFGDYVRFLIHICRHIIPYFSRGCTEVHACTFDNPGQLNNTPKFFEHKRRDELATVATGHNCDDIKELTRLPKKRRENLLHCRNCRRILVCFVGDFMLKYMQTHLSSNQKLYVSRAFTEQLTNPCWFVESNHSPEPDPVFSCNGEETDTMIWLHATKTHCSKITVLSADTDVYMIGLPLKCSLDKISLYKLVISIQGKTKLLSLKNMIVAIQNDPDLQLFPKPLG